MAKIISTVKYPVRVKYDGQTIIVSPKTVFAMAKV